MKTTFILHGGFAVSDKQEDDLFFQEILRTAPQNTHVLLVYFASEASRIPIYEKSDIEQFEKNKGERVLSFEVARDELFLEQAQKADILYLHGGRSEKLLQTLKNYPSLVNHLRGKIIGADSAGANILSSVFYSKSMGVGEGFGIIPTKLICHFKEEMRTCLDHTRLDLPTLYLSEYQFKTMVL
jgi:peptidase E